jgi:hypothetical protein
LSNIKTFWRKFDIDSRKNLVTGFKSILEDVNTCCIKIFGLKTEQKLPEILDKVFTDALNDVSQFIEVRYSKDANPFFDKMSILLSRAINQLSAKVGFESLLNSLESFSQE